jgi:hypothetical protein
VKDAFAFFMRISPSLRRALIGLFFLLPIAQPAAALTIPPGGSLSIAGTLNLGCTDLIDQGTVSVGTGQIVQAANIDTAASGVLDGGSGTISLGGTWSNAGTFVPGSSTVIFADACSTGPAQLIGNTVFNNLTLTSTSGRTFVIPAGQLITVNGTLTLQGLPGLPIQLVSSSGQPQSAFITLGPGAQFVSSNATVTPGVVIGAASIGAQVIPTLGEYGLFILSLLIAAIAAIQGYGSQSPLARRAARIESRGSSRNAE